VGVSVVNALSVRTEVRVWRGGRQFYQAFSRGSPLGRLADAPLAPRLQHRRGTQASVLARLSATATDALGRKLRAASHTRQAYGNLPLHFPQL
jgi:DNA gyrase/topoisomerase IV subunit B